MSEHITYHWDLIQGTDEWLSTRLGLITASQMKHIMAPKPEIETRIKKDGTPYKQKEWDPVADNDKARAILYKIASERITQEIGDNFQSWDMMRGEKEEVLAKDLYSKHYHQVKDCGFITNDSLGFKIGFSPDGLVGEEGGIEVKSRASKFQVQTALFVTERKWWDFISYSNGMYMYVHKVEPDAEWQGALKEACINAEKKIVELVDQYKAKVENLHKAPWIDVMAEADTFKPSTNVPDDGTILDAG